jgi:hypothetical protein
VNNYYGGGYGGRGYYHHSIFWSGGYYLGVCCYVYPEGEYYIPVTPGFFYWSVRFGYGYYFNYEPAEHSGIKFVLDELADVDKKNIRKANVYILDDKGKRGGTLGTVEEFEKKPLLRGPGTYDIAIVPTKENVQEIEMSVEVDKGITRAHPTFKKMSPMAQAAIQANSGEGTGDKKPVPVSAQPPADAPAPAAAVTTPQQN